MAGEAEGPGARVWDPLVRATHWLIALAVVVNGLMLEGDVLAHVWIGYAALGLLALRLLWGVVGSDAARFSAFPPSVAGAVEHVGEILRGEHRAHRSHNPLGAWMAYALWAMLAVVSVTGVMLESEPFPDYAVEHRSEAVADDDDGEHEDGREGREDELIEELHEGAANLLLLLAALHVAGVALESRLSGRNLVGAMISSRRS